MRAPWSHDQSAERASPPLKTLLRAGTFAVGVSLLLGAAVAITTVVATQQAADDLARVVGPLRTDNAVLLRLISQGESAVRGYQMTGDPVTLEPLTAMAEPYMAMIESMREAAEGHEDWERIIDEQDRIAFEWYELYAARMILLVAAGDPGAATDPAVKLGDERIIEMRELNAELDRRLVNYREQRLDAVHTRMVVAVVAIATILAASLAILYWRSRRVRRLVAVPLEEMVDAVTSFQQGDRASRSRVRGSLEVETLSRALDEVAAWTEQIFEADHQRLLQAGQIRELTTHVREGLDERDVLDRAVRQLGPAVGADRVLVLGLNDEGQLGALLAEWVADGFAALGVGGRMPIDRDRDEAIRSGVQLGRSLQAANVAEDSEILPATREFLQSLNVGALLLTPVVAAEGSIAAIALLTHGRTYEWPPEAMPLALAVAADLATALTHARLFEQEAKMVQQLRDLDQAKSDFVSSVSHELRTPLTSIRGYVEMLLDGDAGELDAEQQQMLGVVERNADRLLALIEDLLTLSRIESGAFRATLAPVHLDEIIEGLLAEMATQPSVQDVQLVGEIDTDLPPVLGDTGQLERVLMNLLSNAIKFSPDGGRVLVRARVDDDDDEVVLEVSDKGVGIPIDEQQNLFSRFFRSSVAQERAIKGTGLGLVIAKSIVENHHGRIEVCSLPGEGTTFTVRLPRAPIPAEVS